MGVGQGAGAKVGAGDVTYRLLNKGDESIAFGFQSLRIPDDPAVSERDKESRDVVGI